MSTEPQPPTQSRWAPWWVYVVIIVPANWARAAAMPSDLPTIATVAAAVALAAVLFVAITAVWRASRPGVS